MMSSSYSYKTSSPEYFPPRGLHKSLTAERQIPYRRFKLSL